MSTHIINFPGADIHTTTITSVSNVSVGENLDVTSNLTVSGNTAISQELSVSGNVEVGTANLFVDTTTGNVGVGVAHPMSAKLQVAGSLGMAKGSEFFAGDDVVMELPKHDRPLVKYPEVAMTANSSGGYVASTSSAPNPSYDAHDAFNIVTTSGNGSWHSGPYYQKSTEATPPLAERTPTSSLSSWTANRGSTTGELTTHNGEWLKIQLPHKIKLKSIILKQRDSYPTQKVRLFSIVGSNDDENWFLVHQELSRGGTSTSIPEPDPHVMTGSYVSEAFKYFAIVIYAGSTDNPYDHVAIGEWELYGTEEGDTSVDVVHRSVPNKPGQQHLEVYWDANDSNSYSFADSSNVYDLSGSGVTGTLTNNVTFDSVHNGWITTSTTTSGITGSFSVSGGDWVHSVSYWVKVRALPPSSVDYLFGFATAAAYNSIAHYIKPDGTLVTGAWTLDYPTSDFTIPVGEWFHVTTTYQGGGFSPNVNAKTYINGELKHMGTNLSSGTDGTALGIPTSAQVVYLGYGYGGAATSPEATYGSFRMYNKTLNADQVRELYEYDAPRFGHRQNLVSLHKGNLGVGVAHPTSRFEVAGADGIQEYPPKAMTGYETYIEGHGVFRVSASSEYGPGGRDAWYAFDNSTNGWQQDGNSWDTNGTNYIGSVSFEGISGEFIQLELPHPIKPNQMKLVASVTNRMVTDGILFGRDASNGTWSIIHTLSGYTSWSYNIPQYIGINATGYYDAFTLLVQKISGHTNINIAGINFFGTPAPSSLEDGHMTLGKALTLPRVSGHPAGAETPRAESLVVHYDTTVDSVVSGSTVVDTSGNGLNGALENGSTYSSSLRAFQFDGTNDWLSAPINNSGGAWVHSMSFWFKFNGGSAGGLYSLVHIGAGASTQNIMSDVLVYTDGKIRFGFYANDSDTATGLIDPNIWYHVVCTYNGGAGNASSRLVYINGQSKTLTTVGAYTSSTLNLAANTDVYLGSQQGNSSFPGSISNFKLYNVVLTAEEVAMEYALGRTGKSLNLTDTSLCLGGTAPRAQLDVRGSARFGGIMSYSVPYYFAQQENTGGYAYDEPIVYKTNVVTNYPGSFYSSATNNGYYIPPLPGVYQVHMTAIANGAGSIYIQKFNYVTDSVILHHDKTHFNFTSGGWESISASGLISIDDPGTQAIRIFADGTSGNGIWAYNSYHGCVSIVWVSNI